MHFPKTYGVLSLDYWNTLYRHVGSPSERDQVRVAALLDTCKSLGVAEGETVARTFFSELDSYIKSRWKKEQPTSRDRLLRRLRTKYPQCTEAELDLLLETVYRSYITTIKPEPIEGAESFLAWAADYFSLYIVSNTYSLPGILLARVLALDHLDSFFSGALFSDALGVQKPNTLALKHIAATEGCSPETMLHIGDLLDSDYELALRFGCRFVLFSSELSTERSDLAPGVFRGKARDFSHLRQILEEEFGA